jgi:hypothetical protein
MVAFAKSTTKTNVRIIHHWSITTRDKSYSRIRSKKYDNLNDQGVHATSEQMNMAYWQKQWKQGHDDVDRGHTNHSHIDQPPALLLWCDHV